MANFFTYEERLTLIFVIVCIAAGVVLVVTVYLAYLKIFVYAAIAPLALSTLTGPRELQQTAFSWMRTFVAALLELMGMTLVMRLGAILIGNGGLVSAVGEGAEVNGGLLAMIQCIISVVITAGAVKAVDSMMRRAMGV